MPTTIDDDDPLDISALDGPPYVAEYASEVTSKPAPLLEYEIPARALPKLKPPSRPLSLTNDEIILSALRAFFSRGLFAIGIGMLAAGFGYSMQRDSAGPPMMGWGAFISAITFWSITRKG